MVCTYGWSGFSSFSWVSLKSLWALQHWKRERELPPQIVCVYQCQKKYLSHHYVYSATVKTAPFFSIWFFFPLETLFSFLSTKQEARSNGWDYIEEKALKLSEKMKVTSANLCLSTISAYTCYFCPDSSKGIKTHASCVSYDSVGKSTHGSSIGAGWSSWSHRSLKKKTQINTYIYISF